MGKIEEIKKYISIAEEMLSRSANPTERDAIKAVTYDHIKKIVEREDQ